jgi:hypothetical protein
MPSLFNGVCCGIMQHQTTVVGRFLKETVRMEDITLGTVQESKVRKEHGR